MDNNVENSRYKIKWPMFKKRLQLLCSKCNEWFWSRDVSVTSDEIEGSHCRYPMCPLCGEYDHNHKLVFLLMDHHKKHGMPEHQAYLSNVSPVHVRLLGKELCREDVQPGGEGEGYDLGNCGLPFPKFIWGHSGECKGKEYPDRCMACAEEETVHRTQQAFLHAGWTPDIQQTDHEEALSQSTEEQADLWISIEDALPAMLREVKVETSDGKITSDRLVNILGPTFAVNKNVIRWVYLSSPL